MAFKSSKLHSTRKRLHFTSLVMHSFARFDVALIQARSASECIFTSLGVHSLARRACIENALQFEIRSEIQGELQI